MTDFPKDFVPDFCESCGLPVQKWQAASYDGAVLRHLQCINEDDRNKD